MTTKIQALLSTILVVSLCATTLVKPGLAQLPSIPRIIAPPGSPIDLAKCWSSLVNIHGCETEIFKSIISGKFKNVGPACCKAFTEIDAKCWPKMFPLNPFFPPLLKDACSHVGAAAPALSASKFSIVPGFTLPSSPVDVSKCWSSLSSVEGCVTEIMKSLSTGNLANVGPMCCKAFSVVDAKCWPHMFPLNPFFPPLIKDRCSHIRAVAPAPK